MARCGVIGEHCNGYRFIHMAYSLHNWLAHLAVDILNHMFLQLVIAFMSGFIGSLYVKEHEVEVARKGINCSLSLPGVIGVE